MGFKGNIVSTLERGSDKNQRSGANRITGLIFESASWEDADKLNRMIRELRERFVPKSENQAADGALAKAINTANTEDEFRSCLIKLSAEIIDRAPLEFVRNLNVMLVAADADDLELRQLAHTSAPLLERSVTSP
jgi:hypothetical protein